MHLHKQAASIYLAVTGHHVPQLIQRMLIYGGTGLPIIITHNTKMRRMTVNSSQALQRLFGMGMIFVASKHFRWQ